MSKAVLVMDMPKSCEACHLKSRVHGIQDVIHCCNLAEGMITLDKGFKEKLPNCPLKELPEKMETEAHEEWERGWNAYRDKLLGGAECQK